MFTKIQELAAYFTANTSGFERAVGTVITGTRKIGANFATMAKQVSGLAAGISIAVGSLATAATGAALKVIKASEGQRQAIARLEAVFKATGNAAGISVKQVLAFAAARQAVTNFGDEVTVQGAAVLATFKSIRGEAFTQTMTLAQDLAELMGGDLQGAVLQLGKALEDPTTGLTALRRSGISFTEQQKEVITALMDSGRHAEAQGMILQVVAGQIGGVATAAASPLIQLQNMLSDVAEDIGTAILPAFREFSTALTGIVQDNKDQIIQLAKSFFDWGLGVAKLAAEHPKLASFLAMLAAGHLAGINSGVISLAGSLFNVGKGAASMAKTSWQGASAIAKMGMVANAAKLGLIGLAVAGIGALAVAVYKASAAIRDFNKAQQEGQTLNDKLLARMKKTQDAALEKASSLTGSSKESFVAQAVSDAEKELAGMEAALKGQQKLVAELDTTWKNATGNKILEAERNELDAINARIEQQKAFIESMRGQAGTGGGAAGFLMPDVDVDFEKHEKEAAKAEKDAKKKTEKEAADHEQDMERATESVRDFDVMLGELRDKLSGEEMDSFAASANKLKEALASGSIDLDEFNFRMDGLRDHVQGMAKTAEQLMGFGGKLNDLRDRLPPELLDRAHEAGQELRRRFEEGRITEDQFNTGLSTMEGQLQGAAAGEDFRAQVSTMGYLGGDVQASFNAGITELQNKLLNGQITLEQFNGRLDVMKQELDAAVLAQDAFNKFAAEHAQVPAAAGVVDAFAEKINMLQEQFANGEISMDQFRNSLSMVEQEANKAAEAARMEALMKGDFRGAGLDPQKALQERIQQFRMQQWNQQMDAGFQNWLRMNGLMDQVNSGFQRMTGQMKEFGNGLKDAGQNAMQGVGQALGSQQFSQLAAFMNTVEGQKQLILNQINLLAQNMSILKTYSQRARVQELIDALLAQLEALNHAAPPPLGEWRTDPTFVDPGLSEEEGGRRRGGVAGGLNVNVNSMFPPTPGMERMLADAIGAALSRQGWAL
jgi:uncharacterized membrane protein